MEKKRYYVTVGTGEILPEKTLSEWEFEIDATPKEVEQLEGVFDNVNHDSWVNYWQAHIPFKQYSNFSQIDDYDIHLKNVYEMLNELGTEETKKHIQSMGILD